MLNKIFADLSYPEFLLKINFLSNFSFIEKFAVLNKFSCFFFVLNWLKWA